MLSECELTSARPRDDQKLTEMRNETCANLKTERVRTDKLHIYVFIYVSTYLYLLCIEKLFNHVYQILTPLSDITFCKILCSLCPRYSSSNTITSLFLLGTRRDIAYFRSNTYQQFYTLCFEVEYVRSYVHV